MSRARKLDRRITIQARMDSTSGDPKPDDWVLVATVWAEQMERSQVERFVSDQTLAEAVRGYQIRYRTDVDPTMRVLDDLDDYWQIEGVAEGEGRRRWTVLLCSMFDPRERRFE